MSSHLIFSPTPPYSNHIRFQWDVSYGSNIVCRLHTPHPPPFPPPPPPPPPMNNFITKKWKFSDKNSDIFHTSPQNIDCGYSLEPPRGGGSNDYPQSMLLSRNKKYNVYPCKPQFYFIKVGFKGSKLYRYVFVIPLYTPLFNFPLKWFLSKFLFFFFFIRENCISIVIMLLDVNIFGHTAKQTRKSILVSWTIEFHLTLSSFGKIFSRHSEIFFYLFIYSFIYLFIYLFIYFLQNRILYFMQINNLHEISNPVSGETEKNITNLSSAVLAQSVVKVKPVMQACKLHCCHMKSQRTRDSEFRSFLCSLPELIRIS